MQFDIRSFLESGRKPFEAHFEADFSKADFGGYSVNTPAVCDFTATLTEDGAELLLCVRAHIDAECARCLEPLTRDYDLHANTSCGIVIWRIRILNCRAMRTVVSTSRSSPIRS